MTMFWMHLDVSGSLWGYTQVTRYIQIHPDTFKYLQHMNTVKRPEGRCTWKKLFSSALTGNRSFAN